MKIFMIMSIITGLLGFFGCAKPTPEDRWTIATGDDNGKPMIIRYRANTPAGVDIEQYPHLMAISWKYIPTNEGGMPSTDDNIRMILLEDLLASLESKRTAFLTLSVACNGVKEWQWYARNEEKAMAQLNTVLSGQPPFPIQISWQNDPSWSAYFGFKESAETR